MTLYLICSPRFSRGVVSAAATASSRSRRRVQNNEPAIIEEDPNFDRKLDLVTAGGRDFIKKHLLTKITRQNCAIIIDYILAFQTEVNPSQRYRLDTIFKLKQLAEFHNPKSFRDMSRQDIIEYLDSIRKPESVDPYHKWIGTHETSRIILLRFFKWLYYPDFVPARKRPKPAVMDNIAKLKRREISTYKPTDLWTEEDDALFYKYCPSVRDRCWHAVSRDTACRPHELINLKIKDVIVQRLDSGHQIARITVNGKTGTRHVRLNNSYPRLKEWLNNGHPYAGNPNALLFCGLGKKNTGRKFSDHVMNRAYDYYKKVLFPKLLTNDNNKAASLEVPEEDKRKIRDLLKKPWNPYIRRHTAATEISKSLKDSVLIDQYMGWSHAGNTRQKYQHYLGDDSFDAMLTVMDGLIPATTGHDRKKILKPRLCPNCEESNTPESKFCVKCKFVLSFDAYNEVTEEAEKRTKELEEMKARLKSFERTEQARKEKDAGYDEIIAQVRVKMNEMIARMGFNPIIPPEVPASKQELQDTVVSIVGKKRRIEKEE
jgi:integrase